MGNEFIDNKPEKIQEAEVNKMIKQNTSSEEKQFLLGLCNSYHIANLNSVISMENWLQLGMICANHIKDTSFNITQRMVLITNELYSRNFSNEHVHTFYVAFADNIGTLADSNFPTDITEVKKNIYQELKRLSTSKKQNQTSVPNNPINQMIERYTNNNSNQNVSIPIETKFGDVAFACTILNYKESYIRELCRKGKIPFEKPRGKYIFSRTQLEEWIKQNNTTKRKSSLKVGKWNKNSVKP